MSFNYGFIYCPGGENESSSIKEDNPGNEIKSPDLNVTDDEEKPFMEKVHEALQDWSNKDQADQDFDDTQP